MFRDIEIPIDENAIYMVKVSAKALEEILKIFETNSEGIIVSTKVSEETK